MQWEANFTPVPFGNADLIARGHANGCTVTVDRLRHNYPAALLAGASADQVAQFQAGRKDILDVGVTCPGAP